MKLNEAKIQNFYGVTFDNDSGENKAPVRIPHYQRPYRWPPEYIKTLINDWSEEQKSEYFAGAIVTVLSENGVHQLVDGQQRYTTVFLMNFVCFMLVRTAIREAVLINRLVRIDALLQSYKKCSQYLFSNFDVDKHDEFKDSILSLVDRLNSADDESSVNSIRSELLDKFNRHGFFPVSKEGEGDFKNDYKTSLIKTINSNNVRLYYDRAVFNGNLKEALSSVIFKLDNQNEQSLGFFEPALDSEKPVIYQYQNSIKIIFEHFTKLSSGEEPFLKALNTIKNIESFLNNVKFCIIQTGNEEDAYTLFEVLNDRALSLDDLDLIKNQFYKKFCKSNDDQSLTLVDKNIEKRERQWGDDIFPDGLKLANKPLITYIVSTYLSGESDYLLQSSEKKREKITNYLKKENSYDSTKFERDFNLLQAATCFVTSFDIWHKSKNKKALKAEYSSNFTPTYKLVHFLSALGQYGVLVGLTNVILKYIEIFVSDSFGPKDVKMIFDELINCSDKHVEIHNLSDRIWKLSVQSPSAELPRDYAVELIKSNCLKSKNIDYKMKDFLTVTLKEEFESWLDNWSYSKSDLKVCILFARLLKLSINESHELEQKEFSLSISESEIEKLHLDHMEPSTIPDHNKSSYFEHEDRRLIVNGLGNMFPLPGSHNISKSNEPFKESFKYINKAGLTGHGLERETYRIFIENNRDGVPTYEFFQRRKTLIKELFYQAIQFQLQ